MMNPPTQTRDHLLRQLPRAIFWFGLVVFVVVKLLLYLIPVAQRAEPIETDDAYRYMAQSRAMFYCFDQDCAALSSLEDQISGPSNSPDIAFQRARLDMHLFTYFHPIYSAGLGGLIAAGIGVSTSHIVVTALLGAALLLALAFWLRSIWGDIAAGLALLILAFYVFPDQGLHVFVPSNLALGFGIASLILIGNKQGRAYWAIPLLWISALGMHSIGLFHVASGLILLLVLNRPLGKPAQRLLVAGVLIVGIRVLLALLLPQFSLTGASSFYFETTQSMADQIALMASGLYEPAKNWATSYWSIFALWFFLLVGFFAAQSERQKLVLSYLVALGLPFLGGAFYVHPVHGTTATARLWLPIAILLTGAVANYLVAWVTALFNWVRRQWRLGFQQFKRENLLLSRTAWVGAALLFLALVNAESIGTNLAYGFRHYRLTLDNSVARQNYRLASDRVDAFLSQVDPEATLIFTSEIPLYFTVAQGVLDNQVIYLPAAEDKGSAVHVDEGQGQAYVMSMNPITAIEALGQGRIDLSFPAALELQRPNGDLSEVEVYLENNGEAAELSLRFGETGAEETRVLSIPANSAAWHQLDSLPAGTGRVALSSAAPNTGLTLSGIRVTTEAETQWPWEQGLSLEYQPGAEGDPVVEIDFTYAAISAGLDLNLQVVIDDTSLVIARVVAEP